MNLATPQTTCLPTFDPRAQAWLALEQLEHALPVAVRRENAEQLRMLRHCVAVLTFGEGRKA